MFTTKKINETIKTKKKLKPQTIQNTLTVSVCLHAWHCVTSTENTSEVWRVCLQCSSSQDVEQPSLRAGCTNQT